MKKLFYRLSSSRSFTKLFSNPMRVRLEERRGLISCRKWFLVFVLALAVLTLGRSQEAMSDECNPDDPDFNPFAYWCYPYGASPLQIGASSTVLVYQCPVGQGTNTLTLATATAPDTFTSSGNVLCNFTGQVQGSNIACSYELTF